MATARWVGLVVGGVALGAAAVGIVAPPSTTGRRNERRLDAGPRGSEPGGREPCRHGGTAATARPCIAGSPSRGGRGDRRRSRAALAGSRCRQRARERGLRRQTRRPRITGVLKSWAIEPAEACNVGGVSLYPRYDDDGRNILGYLASTISRS